MTYSQLKKKASLLDIKVYKDRGRIRMEEQRDFGCACSTFNLELAIRYFEFFVSNSRFPNNKAVRNNRGEIVYKEA